MNRLHYIFLVITVSIACLGKERKLSDIKMLSICTSYYDIDETIIRFNCLNLSLECLVTVEGIADVTVSYQGQPVLITEVPNLYINLMNNKLSKLPIEMNRLTNLKFLDISNNSFEQFPSEISNCPLLRLDMSSNLIEVLPQDISNMLTLQELDLRDNAFDTFPQILCTMPCLVGIDISYNFLRRIPAELLSMSHVKRLDLSFNCIRKLPQDFSQMTNLVELDISVNNFSYFPKGVCTIPYLQSLFLNCCDIDCIPSGISSMVYLKLLEMEACFLTHIPTTELAGLHNLRHISIDFMPNKDDSEALQDTLKEGSLCLLKSKFSNNEELCNLFQRAIDNGREMRKKICNWRYNMLVIESEGEFNLLDLSHNNLEDLSSISTLDVLFEHKCVPLSSVTNLYLNLAYNNIQAIPDELSNLQYIIKLDVSGNQLKEIPSSIGNLTELEELIFSRNEDNPVVNWMDKMHGLSQLRRIGPLDATAETDVDIKRIYAKHKCLRSLADEANR